MGFTLGHLKENLYFSQNCTCNKKVGTQVNVETVLVALGMGYGEPSQ